jgi:hypothetical protein
MADSTRSTEAHNYDHASAAKILTETYGGLTIEDITRQYPNGTFNIANRILASEVIKTSSSVPPVLLAMQRVPPSEAIAAPTLRWKTPNLSFSRGRFTYFTDFARLPTELRRKIWFFSFLGKHAPQSSDPLFRPSLSFYILFNALII